MVAASLKVFVDDDSEAPKGRFADVHFNKVKCIYRPVLVYMPCFSQSLRAILQSMTSASAIISVWKRLRKLSAS